jgi:hypothetical protein
MITPPLAIDFHYAAFGIDDIADELIYCHATPELAEMPYDS